MKLVVLGAPGAGKGTQARNLAVHYKIAHISTSDMLRQYLDENNDQRIKDIIRNGGLAPDAIVIDLVKKRLDLPGCENGFIFDGFPRTLEQAQALAEIVPDLNYAVSIVIGDKLIVERISGRIICPNCSKMFHTFYYPPKKDGICDDCSSTLIQREDDKTYTVINRLKVYHEMTEPIIEYYRQRGILCEISGIGGVVEITDEIIKRLAVPL